MAIELKKELLEEHIRAILDLLVKILTVKVY